MRRLFSSLQSVEHIQSFGLSPRPLSALTFALSRTHILLMINGVSLSWLKVPEIQRGCFGTDSGGSCGSYKRVGSLALPIILFDGAQHGFRGMPIHLICSQLHLFPTLLLLIDLHYLRILCDAIDVMAAACITDISQNRLLLKYWRVLWSI